MNLFDLCINAGVASGRLKIQIEGAGGGSSLEVDTRLQGGEHLPLVALTLAEP